MELRGIALLLSSAVLLCACGSRTETENDFAVHGFDAAIDRDSSTRDSAVNNDGSITRDSAMNSDGSITRDGATHDAMIDPDGGLDATAPHPCGPGYTYAPDGVSCVYLPAVDVEAGGTHVCSLLSDGAVACWGGNESGQLGDGTAIARARPGVVSGNARVVQLALDRNTTCALLADGTALCWGFDWTVYPRPVPELRRATQLAVTNGFGCARLQDATVACWGDNGYGQLGDGTTNRRDEARPVPGLTNVLKVGVGYSLACALIDDGTVHCWGHINILDPSTLHPTPVPIDGISDAIDLDVARFNGCVRTSDGSVLSWGSNEYGQVGDGTSNNWVDVPTTLRDISHAQSVSLSGVTGSALLRDGSVRYWGAWRPTYVLTPIAVATVDNAIDATVGSEFGCALLDDARVRCWGTNDYGQLGDGTVNPSDTPVTVIW